MINVKITTFIAVTLLYFTCQAQDNKLTFPDFSYEGHRGARGLYPENTIKGMYKAMDLGVTTLEMDTHITKDGQVVLSHDAYLNPKFVRTPDGKDISERNHIIYQMTYDNLKHFDVGTKDHVDFSQQVSVKEHIPLLMDLIDSVESYAIRKGMPLPYYNIETKTNIKHDGKHHPDPKTFVDLLIEVITKKEITDRVVIQSFDPRTLRILNVSYPHIRTSFLTGNKKKSVRQNIEELGFVPFIYSPSFKLVDSELVDICHNMNMKVVPWTANTTEEIERLKSLNVDGIITDYPNLFGKSSQ